MKKYAKIINEETKEVQVGVGCPDEYYIEIGMTEMDVEQAYNGDWYVAGYAPEEPPQPEPTEDEKKATVRMVRRMMLQMTDFTQLNDAPLDDTEKQYYREYRQYLRDYTEIENWWEQNPDDYETWLVAHHPVTDETMNQEENDQT